MTTPQRSFTVTSGNNGDSQESQDDYGAFDLDLDDPELLAALGNEEHSIVQDNKLNEELVCDVSLFNIMLNGSWNSFTL